MLLIDYNYYAYHSSTAVVTTCINSIHILLFHVQHLNLKKACKPGSSTGLPCIPA